MSGQPMWMTGLGVASPLGCDYPTFAANLLAGTSGVKPVAAFDASNHPCKIAGRLDAVPCPEGWEPAAFAKLDRREQLVLWCATTALRDSGWWDKRDTVRMGLVLGAGAEWMLAWEEDALAGGRAIVEPEGDRVGLAERVRQRLGLSGPVLTVSAACASGNYALMMARRWLAQGWVDVCLAGAGDLGATPMSLAAFGNLRALSRRNDAPAQASRPFDKGRDGFVVGEGGALFVLEPEAGARRRGAKVYAALAGCGASSDAHHMVIPSPDPAPAAAAMRQALADAGANPADVGYVNAHATSTPVGDVGEARVLHSVFGEAVKGVPVSSTKSMTGHLLTGAAAVEAVACVVALERQAVPPTINLDDPDPACDLCHVPHQARPSRIKVAVSNSFGFGGSNTCVLLRAV